LLGASLGIGLGLIEAGCLRLVDVNLSFSRPHVPVSFWFFAPLLTSVIFGLLGWLAGFAAALLKSRFPGMVVLAGLAGAVGNYFWMLLQSYPSGGTWFIFLREMIPPRLVFTLVFGCTLAALWATRRPDSPLGALAAIPTRPWSMAVFSLIAFLAAGLVMSHLPDRLAGSPAHASTKSASPNIVLIVMDATRADHLSCYGYARNTSPNVDQIAKRGVLFENALSSSSWTLPSMASIFTGLLPHQHGAGADTPLGEGPRTLAELLQVGGYETTGFNANAYYGDAAWGLGRGFESYTDSTSTLGYSLHASRLGRDFIEPASEKWFHRSRFNQFTAGQLNEEVYRWFEHRSGRPFFLLVHYNDIHDPYEVSSPYDHLYGQLSEEEKSELPEVKVSHLKYSARERGDVIAAYDDALKYVDSQVGELLRFLEASPEWPNTYVIITADHGEAFGEHGTYTHGWDLYREILRVPLIIVGPGVPAGVRVQHNAATRRIFATALEWGGAKGAILRRAGLPRLWSSDYVPELPDEAVLSEMCDVVPPPAPQGLISITTSEWHYIYGPGYHRTRLYHWPADPLEQHDLSELPEYQAIMESLKARLISIAGSSYRPWRDIRYLQAFSGLAYPSGTDPSRLDPSLLGSSLAPRVPGAVQAMFPPNPEAPHTINPDEDLVRSIPYAEP
jgi:arylsulfatase A-like enzyme